MKRLSHLTMLSAATIKEHELVIFGKLAPDVLAKMGKEAESVTQVDQYSWSRGRKKNGRKTTMRVRRYHHAKDDRITYELSTKAYGGIGNADESNADINEEMFNTIKSFAPTGHIFIRYVYAIPNSDLKWEIDVMFGKGGHPMVPWAKLDLEVPEGYDGGVPSVPEGLFTQIIDRPYEQRSLEENQILNELFTNQFYFNNIESDE